MHRAGHRDVESDGQQTQRDDEDHDGDIEDDFGGVVEYASLRAAAYEYGQDASDRGRHRVQVTIL